LKRIWDSPNGKILKQYIKRFDDDSVEIKTKKEGNSTSGTSGQSSVAKMAKAATARRQG